MGIYYENTKSVSPKENLKLQILQNLYRNSQGCFKKSFLKSFAKFSGKHRDPAIDALL